MSRSFLCLIFSLLLSSLASAQTPLQEMSDADSAFGHEIETMGMKNAALKFLSSDSVIFQPNAVSGRDYWKLQSDKKEGVLVRERIAMDIAASGLMGYTTGTWKLYPKGLAGEVAKTGEYVTMWEKRQGGKFEASLDITIEHDPITPELNEKARVWPSLPGGDPNKRRWSAADPSMNFLKMSMTKKALGGAYEKFAGEDIRLLLEGEFPILGKKAAVKATRNFVSIDYPKRTALLESSDMAFVWNPCEYADSNEGKEKGICLHVWKLRDKKYYIVLGVLSRVKNMTRPTLKVKDRGSRQ